MYDPKKKNPRVPRPRFTADIIGTLRHMVIDHNNAPGTSNAVKLGDMKKLYAQGYKGPHPHDRAMTSVQAHLADLANQGAGDLERQGVEPVSASANPQSPIKTIPRPIKIKTRLFAADFLTALTAAGIQEDPGEEARQTAAESVATAVQSLVARAYNPTISDLQETGASLAEIQHACERALTVIFSRLVSPPSSADPEGTLAHAIQTSLNPMIMGLLDVSRGMSGGSPDGKTLAQAILATEDLRSWARAASLQQEAGMERERVSRQDWAARSPGRALGVSLIESYQALSDRPLSFSRPSSGIAAKPTGPLIRYLSCLFECARRSLSEDPEFAPLAEDSTWNPSAEAFAVWITDFRKDDSDSEEL